MLFILEMLGPRELINYFIVPPGFSVGLDASE